MNDMVKVFPHRMTYESHSCREPRGLRAMAMEISDFGRCRGWCDRTAASTFEHSDRYHTSSTIRRPDRLWWCDHEQFGSERQVEKGGREVKVRSDGQLVFNSLGMRLSSALDGLGITYVPEDQVLPYVSDGRLIRVLEDWCPKFPGYHLYYPSRRHSSPALTLLVENLRYRGN